MKYPSTIAMTLAIGVSLSGCQALFGPRAAHLNAAENRQMADAPEAVHPALDQGRQLLKAGRTAQAIELLRVAQRDPSSMADASNGLGVAYARLGRHDLADRYFRMALALEPGDARFAANMLRLQRDHKLAVRRNEEAALLAQRAEEQRQAALARRVEPGQIERLSRGQVHVQTKTAPERLAPRMEVLALRTPSSNTNEADLASKLHKSSQDDVDMTDTAKSYPLSIDFTKQPNNRSMAPARRNYPVRVYIGA